MALSTREMREYMAKRRGSVPWRSLLEDAGVLAAWAAGEVTTGRASKTLGLDIVELRVRGNALVDKGKEACGVHDPADPSRTPYCCEACADVMTALDAAEHALASGDGIYAALLAVRDARLRHAT